jgi:radical SAM superfamily enzyme YgiQ (UPF0313 family)
MRYELPLFRPPSEADAFILQATIGCSWNHCTYCDMYRSKEFRLRELDEVLDDIELAASTAGDRIQKVFVADGDALIMSVERWQPILERCRARLPRLRRISCYAMASNILSKSPEELATLRALGLELLYIGPESGDDVTLKRIAKGATFADHVAAAERARAAGLEMSVIFLLGAGGKERSEEHALASAALATAMDPAFLAALTLTVVEGTPIARLQDSGRFERPDIAGLLGELRTFVAAAAPTEALFRTNHASNYLPLGGRLPHDRDRLVAALDRALAGGLPLRPEWTRGL